MLENIFQSINSMSIFIFKVDMNENNSTISNSPFPRIRTILFCFQERE